MPKKQTKEEWETENQMKEEDFEADMEEAKTLKESEYDTEEPKTGKNKFRYYCDACTNIAFYSEKAEEGLKGTCQICGKQYVTRKENYIKL